MSMQQSLTDVPSARLHFAGRPTGPNSWRRVSRIFSTFPKAEQWRWLRSAITVRGEFGSDAIAAMDSQMKGCLFVEPWVAHREERIDYALNPTNSIHLRISAGSHQVWFSDSEFTNVVCNGSVRDLACFARSSQMRPHHLMCIELLLSLEPLSSDGLPTAYETSITLKQSLELYGHCKETQLFRDALSHHNNSGAKLPNRTVILSVWHRYMATQTQSGLSAVPTFGPARSGGLPGHQVH